MKPQRLFIALELPAPIPAQLAQVTANLKQTWPRDTMRWVKPEGIHLTLKFFGEVPPERGSELERALQTSVIAAQPFNLEMGGLGVFPDPFRPRVLWLGLSGDLEKLHALQQAIEAVCTPLGFAPEGRAFSPHLTLGRFHGIWLPAHRAYLTTTLKDSRWAQLGTFTANTLTLIQSDLKPAGAVYTRRWAAPLGGSLNP